MWDILPGMLLGDMLDPGPPTTEKGARRRVAYALSISAVLFVGGVVLVVIGAVTDDPDNRTTCFVFAGCCLFFAGLAWYNARRFVLDQREGRY